MAEKNKDSGEYQKIDPEDFQNYEEQFVVKGGGGGKTTSQKGKKTIRALKKQQKSQSVEERRKEIENSLKSFLRHFANDDTPEILQKRISRYIAWIEENLNDPGDLSPSDCVITFAKSGGPGGQNVNKRETKVMIIHKITNFRVDSDQTRSQIQNRKIALEILQERLDEHLSLWKEYLGPGNGIDPEQVKLFLD